MFFAILSHDDGRTFELYLTSYVSHAWSTHNGTGEVAVKLPPDIIGERGETSWDLTLTDAGQDLVWEGWPDDGHERNHPAVGECVTSSHHFLTFNLYTGDY